MDIQISGQGGNDTRKGKGTSVSLRAHHLICLRLFEGQGYSRAFVENLERVLASVNAGTPVRVVTGPDDVCGACHKLEDGSCPAGPDEPGEITRLDRLAERLLAVVPGDTVSYPALAERALASMTEGWRAEACEDCEWRSVCLDD